MSEYGCDISAMLCSQTRLPEGLALYGRKAIGVSRVEFVLFLLFMFIWKHWIHRGWHAGDWDISKQTNISKCVDTSQSPDEWIVYI